MGVTTLCFQPPFLWPQWSTSLRRLMPAYQRHPPEAGAEPNGRETARSNCHGSKPPNWGWFLRPISGNLGDGSTETTPTTKIAKSNCWICPMLDPWGPADRGPHPIQKNLGHHHTLRLKLSGSSSGFLFGKTKPKFGYLSSGKLTKIVEIHGFPWEIDRQKVDFPYLGSFIGRYIPTCQAWSNWDARTVGGFDVAGGIRHGMAVHSRRHWHRRRLLSGSVQFVPRSSTSAGTVRGYSVDKLTSLLPSSVWRNAKRSMWRMSMLEQAWQPWQLRCKLIKLDLLESSIHKGCPDSYSQDGTMPRLTGAPHMPRSELVPCWDSESPKLQSFEKSSIFCKRSTRPFFGPPPFGGSPAEISLDRAIVRQHLVELIKGDLQRGLQGSHTESWGINRPPNGEALQQSMVSK